ncbi:unnamed protein product [Menidia menidia]|uniref:(Atlantic silverside) hypothetical protein n=1 Tax=Menidia menidia TaxID=238744 RepID=A0A8S4BHB5_9TELE|nr:unnamed protein product [Menidia menidia]
MVVMWRRSFSQICRPLVDVAMVTGRFVYFDRWTGWPDIQNASCSLISSFLCDISRYSMMSDSQRQQANDPRPCINPGNPVFSCMINPSVKSEEFGNVSKSLYRSILYRTTSSDYGLHPPTYESSPISFHPKSQAFSKQMSYASPPHSQLMMTNLLAASATELSEQLAFCQRRLKQNRSVLMPLPFRYGHPMRALDESLT